MDNKLNLDIVYPRAANSTINKLLARIRTRSLREVRKHYNIRAKALRSFTVARRSRRALLIANLVIKGPRLPIHEFGAKQRRKGVSVRIRKDTGRTVIKGTFIAELSSGKISVFKRRNEKRLPIDILYTTSPAQMFEQEGVKAAENVLDSDAAKILTNEIKFFESKLGKGK